VVLMLVTCEVATRLFARVPRDVSMRDPLIGRRFEPGLNEFVYNAEIDAPVLLRTNRWGFRGEDVSEEKPAGVRRVAVLGDSYTAAMALEEDQTFCGRLEQLLNKSSSDGAAWQVLNFGIFGSGTGQELALYRHLVRDLQPDIVIVAFGNATDLRDNSAELSTNPIIQFAIGDSGRPERIPQSAERIRLSNLLNNTSRFYTWQKMKSKSLKLLWQQKADVERGRTLIYSPDEPPAYARAWELTTALFQTFRDECRDNGSQFMVAAIPSAYQVYADHFAELQAEVSGDQNLDPLHPDRRLETACRSLGIPFLSLAPTFRSHAPSGSCQTESEQLFIHGKGHLNERGSRLAAQEMSAWLTETQVAAVSREQI
ncbi:MAG: hypothetical protein KDA89_16195, partial [Planctomycetaceae bacterium]|nr:hypothetical protein [Planctomycetaceae bacterium]